MFRVSSELAAWWSTQKVRLSAEDGAEFLEVALWSIAILGVGGALVAIFQKQLSTLFQQIGG